MTMGFLDSLGWLIHKEKVLLDTIQGEAFFRLYPGFQVTGDFFLLGDREVSCRGGVLVVECAQDFQGDYENSGADDLGNPGCFGRPGFTSVVWRWRVW